MLNFNVFDYASIVFYCLIFILIGFWFTRLKIDSDTFFSSRHQLPGWLAGISYFMTGYSANIFTAGIAAYLIVGFAPLASGISVTLAGAVFAFIWAAKWWHRSGVDSVPAFMERHYGASGRNFILSTNMPAMLLGDAIRFYINGFLITTVTGIPLYVTLPVTSFVLLVYVMAGGLWGAVITDTIQCFLLFLLLVLMVVLSVAKVGGITALFHNLPVAHYDLFPGGGFSFFQTGNGLESWCVAAFIFGILINGPMCDSTIWACVQRYTSTQNLRETRKVPLYYVGLTIPMLLLLAVPALAANIFLPELKGTWASAETAYIKAAQVLLPHGVVALLITGILSANMSTLSSNVVIYSQTLSQDLYQRRINPDASEKRMLWMGRLITFSCIVLCTLLGLLAPLLGGIFWSNVIVGSIMGPAMWWPAFISLFYKKTPGWGMIASCLTAMAAGVFLNFSRQMGLTELEIAFWIRSSATFFIVLAGMILTGELYPPAGERKRLKDELFDRMHGREAVREGSAAEKAARPKEALPPFFLPVNAMIGLPLVLFGLFIGAEVMFSATAGTLAYSGGLALCAILTLAGLLLLRNNGLKRREYETLRKGASPQ